MSRTYRRKNVIFYHTEKEIRINYITRELERLYETRKDYIKAERMYHTDKLCTMEQVPKWYKVYFCRKPYKAKVKAMLRKELKSIEHGNIMFPIIKNNSKYYW